jgi:hypothetical protein
MALSAKYRNNAFVQRDPNQTLTIKRKAFANNIGITVNGVVELSRYIASVSAYIASDRLILEELSLSSMNKNATIYLLEENGWNHRCSQQKDFNTANFFTEGKGIPSTKTVSITQSLGSSSIASPKTIAQLITQRSALTNASNALSVRDYTGHIALSDAAKTTNAVTGKKAMGANAFTNCPRLKSVRMSSDNAWGEFFSTGCFKSCAALTTINTVTNSNSSRSANVAVTPPAGTISVAHGATAVTGSNGTLFTTLVAGQMLYTGSSTREGGKYIGTVQSIQSNTQLTLTLPSALGTFYSGTFRMTTEAMIPAHATTVGQEALRGTNVRVVTFESHLNPTLAASNSRLVSIGSNAFTDCPNLITLNFSVKQSSALNRLGLMSDIVIPLATKLNVISNDGWANSTTQAQLSTLLNVTSGRFLVTPNFTYIARLDPSVLDANNQPMRIATITGLTSQDAPVNFSNLVVPEYIMHSDGNMYQVYDINYPFIDQVETIVGQPNRVYGAFSKNHPAFNIGGQVGGLSGTLTLPKTLRSVGSNSFEAQSLLRGNLTVAGVNLVNIGEKCFYNAFAGGRTMLIMGKIAPSIGSDAYSGTSFNPIYIRPMDDLELIQYAY